ncbi:MAG: hypothetical protein UU21_C0001G0034 [Candidatus Levybacteria bacterium GW2011_GWA2_40_8]|nr:MAG: hypothetical protein UU21_C0001G0034 [Candidatus Levybacteria bacterium GW2011_GWA2_40_8]
MGNLDKCKDIGKESPCQGNFCCDRIVGTMDISLLGTQTLRIKGKGATIVVDPDEKTPKTEADAVVMFKGQGKQIPSKIENPRVLIQGPGEYEIGGIKISSQKANGGLVHELYVDGIKVLLGDPSILSKVQEKIGECQVALFKVSENFDQSIISAIEPNVVIMYGEGAEEGVKKMGVSVKEKTSKYSINAEKIPEEFEAIILE